MTPRLVLAFLLAFALAACDRSAPPKGSGASSKPPKEATAPAPIPDPSTAPPPPIVTPGADPALLCPADAESAVVTDAHDGDTITLEDGRKVRYIGLDTPEVAGRNSADEPGAREATDRNKQLVVGRRVRLEYDVEREDRFGRTLAYVWIQDASGKDAMVNELLLREGMGSVFPFKETHRYAEVFGKAQATARRAGVGIWTTPWVGDAPYYVAYNKERFHASTCDGLENATKENEVRFATLEEALDSGRAWCRNCRKKK